MNCKYCQPDGDFWGYDIENIKIETKTTRGTDRNTARANIDNYGCTPKKEIVIKWSWYGRMNKEFRIPIKYCPYCGRKL